MMLWVASCSSWFGRNVSRVGGTEKPEGLCCCVKSCATAFICCFYDFMVVASRMSFPLVKLLLTAFEALIRSWTCELLLEQ